MRKHNFVDHLKKPPEISKVKWTIKAVDQTKVGKPWKIYDVIIIVKCVDYEKYKKEKREEIKILVGIDILDVKQLI